MADLLSGGPAKISAPREIKLGQLRRHGRTATSALIKERDTVAYLLWRCSSRSRLASMAVGTPSSTTTGGALSLSESTSVARASPFSWSLETVSSALVWHSPSAAAAQSSIVIPSDAFLLDWRLSGTKYAVVWILYLYGTFSSTRTLGLSRGAALENICTSRTINSSSQYLS